MQLFLS